MNPHNANGIPMAVRNPPAWVLENSLAASSSPEPQQECTEFEETKVDYEERFI